MGRGEVMSFMERSHLLSLLVLVVVISFSTFTITQTIKQNSGAQTVVKKIVVMPTASPSATVFPTITQAIRKSSGIVTVSPSITTGVVK